MAAAGACPAHRPAANPDFTTADRLISMRDGAFVDETRLTGGTTGRLGAPVGLED